MQMPRPVPKVTYKRRKPVRRKRNNFSKKVRQEILERDDYKCQQCGGRGTQIHHVMPRGRNGRGVVTNGLTLCDFCHDQVHQNADLLNGWIKHYKSFFGDEFWKDGWDE